MTTDFSLYLVSWNVSESSPPSDLSVLLGLDEKVLPDLYAIGLQELKSDSTTLITDSIFDDQWTNTITSTLSDKGYVRIKSLRLVGIHLSVYIKRLLLPNISSVESEFTRTGFGGLWGSKGGVSIRLNVNGVNICLVNSHFSAHLENYAQRIEDYNQVLLTQRFRDANCANILDNDYVFWFGDLNFRLNDLSNEEVRHKVTEGNYEELLAHDQLNSARSQEMIFLNFEEGRIAFPPTFKFDIDSDDYDTSPKNRIPAWCDRILWRVHKDAFKGMAFSVKQHSYSSLQHYRNSDHKPVVASFDVKVLKEAPVLPVMFEPMSSWSRGKNHKVVYSISKEFPTSSRDWIGLYPANFRNFEEYATYTWVPLKGEDNFDGTYVYKAVFEDRDIHRLQSGSYKLLYFSAVNNYAVGYSDDVELLDSDCTTSSEDEQSIIFPGEADVDKPFVQRVTPDARPLQPRVSEQSFARAACAVNSDVIDDTNKFVPEKLELETVPIETEKLISHTDEVPVETEKLISQADEVPVETEKLISQADEVPIETEKLMDKLSTEPEKLLDEVTEQHVEKDSAYIEKASISDVEKLPKEMENLTAEGENLSNRVEMPAAILIPAEILPYKEEDSTKALEDENLLKDPSVILQSDVPVIQLSETIKQHTNLKTNQVDEITLDTPVALSAQSIEQVVRETEKSSVVMQDNVKDLPEEVGTPGNVASLVTTPSNEECVLLKDTSDHHEEMTMVEHQVLEDDLVKKNDEIFKDEYFNKIVSTSSTDKLSSHEFGTGVEDVLDGENLKDISKVYGTRVPETLEPSLLDKIEVSPVEVKPLKGVDEENIEMSNNENHLHIKETEEALKVDQINLPQNIATNLESHVVNSETEEVKVEVALESGVEKSREELIVEKSDEIKTVNVDRPEDEVKVYESSVQEPQKVAIESDSSLENLVIIEGTHEVDDALNKNEMNRDGTPDVQHLLKEKDEKTFIILQEQQQRQMFSSGFEMPELISQQRDTSKEVDHKFQEIQKQSLNLMNPETLEELSKSVNTSSQATSELLKDGSYLAEVDTSGLTVDSQDDKDEESESHTQSSSSDYEIIQLPKKHSTMESFEDSYLSMREEALAIKNDDSGKDKAEIMVFQHASSEKNKEDVELIESINAQLLEQNVSGFEESLRDLDDDFPSAVKLETKSLSMKEMVEDENEKEEECVAIKEGVVFEKEDTSVSSKPLHSSIETSDHLENQPEKSEVPDVIEINVVEFIDNVVSNAVLEAVSSCEAVEQKQQNKIIEKESFHSHVEVLPQVETLSEQLKEQLDHGPLQPICKDNSVEPLDKQNVDATFQQQQSQGNSEQLKSLQQNQPPSGELKSEQGEKTNIEQQKEPELEEQQKHEQPQQPSILKEDMKSNDDLKVEKSNSIAPLPALELLLDESPCPEEKSVKYESATIELAEVPTTQSMDPQNGNSSFFDAYMELREKALTDKELEDDKITEGTSKSPEPLINITPEVLRTVDIDLIDQNLSDLSEEMGLKDTMETNEAEDINRKCESRKEAELLIDDSENRNNGDSKHLEMSDDNTKMIPDCDKHEIKESTSCDVISVPDQLLKASGTQLKEVHQQETGTGHEIETDPIDTTVFQAFTEDPSLEKTELYQKKPSEVKEEIHVSTNQ